MIQIRLAESDEDRLAVLRIGHAAFDGDRPFLERAPMRLSQRRRTLARWWLLVDDRQPVACLHDYPLVFGGRRVGGGAGIGLVGTLPSHRGRGHANALLHAALEAAEAEGRDRALLFSGIPPAFYERLGFRAVACGGVKTTRGAELGAGDAADLVPLEPWRHLDRLVGLYEAAHGDALHLHRDRARWEANLHHGANHDYFLTDGPDAYVRMSEDSGEHELVELFAPPERHARIWRAVGRLVGNRELTSWVEPPDELRGFFEPLDRSKQLPMVRGEPALDGARFWSSDYF